MTNEAPAPKPELKADTLKALLWDAMQAVRAGTMDSSTAEALARTSRELVRTVQVQLTICSSIGRRAPPELVRFAIVDESELQRPARAPVQVRR